MPRYRYVGFDAAGKRVTGERDAANPDALLEAIAAEVTFVESVHAVHGEPSIEREQPSGQMTPGQTVAVSGHVAEIVEAGLPLESGLAAVAAELPQGRTGIILRQIVRRLESGESLEEVLRTSGAPPYLQALVRAGAKSGQTGGILEQYVTHAQGLSELRGTVGLALAYPLVVFAILFVLGDFVLIWVVPQFIQIFEGFGIELPAVTQALVFVTKLVTEQTGVVLGVFLAILALLIGLYVLSLREPTLRRVFCSIPVIGPMVRSIALSRFSQLFSLLIGNRVPMADSLVLAADGCGDAEIRAECRRMAARVNAGESLDIAAHHVGGFPSGFIGALSWETHQTAFPEILLSLGDMYANRARAFIAVLVTLIPPVLITLMGFTVGFIVIALFMPLIRLLNMLS